MATVLIVDDDEQLCDLLSEQVRRMGHDAARAYTLQQGARKARAFAYDVVFLDVNLPDGSGLDALPWFQETYPQPEIIILTGLGDPDGAELAIRNGVWDYLEKSSSLNAIILSLSRALRYREERMSIAAPVALKRTGIIGDSPKLRACLDSMAQAAVSEAHVLITGETGTGKEIFSRAIHENSSRADQDFVVVDCTTLPENLVESLLLGHVKGAFTGADRDREGLIKQADAGTLFLDEIGDLPLLLQSSFLRVLQERRFRPVGGEQEVASDFRLIAATNQDLERMAHQGAFRQDLLYRLRGMTIELPPLRDRREDIKLIAMHHINLLCERSNMELKGFSPEFFEALTLYDWPGNVRELIYALDGSFALAGNAPTLHHRHLPLQFRIQMARTAPFQQDQPATEPELAGKSGKDLPKFRAFRKSAEKQYLGELMAAVSFDVKQACKLSGLSRSRLYDLLKEHNIRIPE